MKVSTFAVLVGNAFLLTSCESSQAVGNSAISHNGRGVITAEFKACLPGITDAYFRDNSGMVLQHWKSTQGPKRRGQFSPGKDSQGWQRVTGSNKPLSPGAYSFDATGPEKGFSGSLYFTTAQLLHQPKDRLYTESYDQQNEMPSLEPIPGGELQVRC
ncbi:hypothetical protein GCM10027599_05610 [Yimella radicis]